MPKWQTSLILSIVLPLHQYPIEAFQNGLLCTRVRQALRMGLLCYCCWPRSRIVESDAFQRTVCSLSLLNAVSCESKPTNQDIGPFHLHSSTVKSLKALWQSRVRPDRTQMVASRMKERRFGGRVFGVGFHSTKRHLTNRRTCLGPY